MKEMHMEAENFESEKSETENWKLRLRLNEMNSVTDRYLYQVLILHLIPYPTL